MATRPQHFKDLPALEQWLTEPLAVEKLLVPPGGNHFVSKPGQKRTLEELRKALAGSKGKPPQPIWLEEWHWPPEDVHRDLPLDARSQEFGSEMTFVRCRFASTVVATGARFRRHVTMVGCIFEGSLTLAGAHFEGGVTFHECYFGMEEGGPVDAPVRAQGELSLNDLPAPPPPPAPGDTKPAPFARLHEAPARSRSAWWPGLRVTGILRLDRCDFAGSLNLAESRIAGPLLMRGIRVGCHRRPSGKHRGRLHLRQVRVEGDIDLTPHVFDRQFEENRQSVVWGSIVLSACDVSGRVDVAGACVLGRLHLPLSHIRDRLIAGAWIHALDQECGYVRVAAFGDRSEVAVRLADAVIEHGVWMDGARLYGQLNAKNAKIGGDFYLRAARHEEGDTEQTPRQSEALRRYRARLWMPQASVKDAVRMPGAEIAGSLELGHARVRGTLNLENLKVGGDLILHELRQEAAQGFIETKRKNQKAQGCNEELGDDAVLAEEFAIRLASIDEEQFTDDAVLAKEVTIRLRTVRVGRTLDLRGAQVAGGIGAHGLHVEGDGHFGAWQPRSPEGTPLFPDPLSWHSGIYHGTVNLTGARIEGDLRFCGGVFHAPLLAEGIQVGHRCDFTGAIFCGPVDFDDARILGELLAGHSRNLDGSGDGGNLPVSRWTRLGTWFMESLTLRRAEIMGDFRFEYLHLGHTPSLQAKDGRAKHLEDAIAKYEKAREEAGEQHAEKTRLNLRLTKIAGAWSSPREPHNNQLTPPISVKAPTEMNTHTQWFLTVCGSVHAEHAEVNSRLQLAWVHITGSMKLENASIGGDLILHRSVIEQDLDLSSATVVGDTFEPSVSADFKLAGHAKEREEAKEKEALDSAVAVKGTLNLSSSSLQNLRLTLKAGLPKHVDLLQAKTGRLSVFGTCPIPDEPFIEMSGLHFEELVIKKLKGCEAHGFARHLLWRRRLYTGRFYPIDEAFFLRQMVGMDAGLYTRVEEWLRSRNLHEAADHVYIERRLQEMEHDFFTSYLLFICWAVTSPLGRLLRSCGLPSRGLLGFAESCLRVASPDGRYAFQHEVQWRKRRIAPAAQIIGELVRRFLIFPIVLFAKLRLVLVGDGARPVPLVLLWLVLFAFSTFCVFSSPESVEHPATFVTPLVNRSANLEPLPGPAVWLDRMGSPPAKDDRAWCAKDGVWVALNVHVPLVQFLTRNEWEPASDPGHWLVALPYLERASDSSFPLVRFRNHAFSHMQYDTYAGLMQIFGWLSVPLFLSTISGLLKKRA